LGVEVSSNAYDEQYWLERGIIILQSFGNRSSLLADSRVAENARRDVSCSSV